MHVVCLQCHEVVQSGDSAQTCCVVWLVPENIETVVTLFRDPRRCEFEDKDWSFSIEVMVNMILSLTLACAVAQGCTHIKNACASLIFLISLCLLMTRHSFSYPTYMYRATKFSADVLSV